MTDPGPSGAPQESQGGYEDSFLVRNNIHPVVFAFVCLFLVFILYQVIGGTVTFLVVGQAEVTRDNVTLIRVLTLVGQILFILLPTLVFARLLNTRPMEVFQWKLPGTLETFFAALSLLFLQQVLQIYLFFQEMLPMPQPIREILEPLRESLEAMFRGIVSAQSIPELVLVLLVVAIAPAVIEEMFFRGVVQYSFDRVVRPIWSAVIVGVIFALYHFNPFALVPLVVLGSFFGFLRYRSRSIVVAMTAHFINNALAVLALYSGMEEDMLVGPIPTDEAALASVLSQLLIVGTLFVLGDFNSPSHLDWTEEAKHLHYNTTHEWRTSEVLHLSYQ